MKKESRFKILKQFNIEIVVYAILCAIYYGHMMFTNGPWYDELYTYYSFISRGPVYAAIHWPVPNNHVGYSVLSAILDLFGNQYIGLRGVSFIAAVSNVVLVYVLALKLLNKSGEEQVNRALSLLASVIYSGAWVINNLSVQGRGYSLAITCLLVALLKLYRICVEGCRLSDYVIFAVSLTLGLYVLPSSMYWVIPVCLIGGFYLLSKKQTTIMWRLILTSVIAAVMVVGLYTIIWLAIGANLLSKNADSVFYGIHQVKIILKAPFQSVGTGIDYMLSTPYIQSIDRKAATFGMPGYIRDLFDQCYSGLGMIMAVFMLAIIVASITMAIRRFHNNNQYFEWLIIAGMLTIPVIMLLIQSVHPYKRVCSFIMVPFAIGLVCSIKEITDLIKAVKVKATTVFLLLTGAIVLVAIKFFSYDYIGPIADRENKIASALETYVDAGGDIAGLNKAFYTDDFQKYVLKFYYDLEPLETSLEEADFVMIGPDDTDEWPVLISCDEDMLKYIMDNFSKVYAADDYNTDGGITDSGYTLYVR